MITPSLKGRVHFRHAHVINLDAGNFISRHFQEALKIRQAHDLGGENCRLANHLRTGTAAAASALAVGRERIVDLVARNFLVAQFAFHAFCRLGIFQDGL